MFEGDGAMQLRVSRLVDDAHRAGAEAPDDLVATCAGARGEAIEHARLSAERPRESVGLHRARIGRRRPCGARLGDAAQPRHRAEGVAAGAPPKAISERGLG